MPTRFSFIVPFHRGLVSLEQCIRAIRLLTAESELIIVADGAEENCQQVASAHRARVITVRGPSGPAAARNAGAAAATGNVLVFVDADVVVSRSGLAHMRRMFDEQPATAAVFGSYDESPEDPGFMSQYKNLSHSFIHHSAESKARTFWAGFGAVRREAFFAVGGFDERFERPSVEDIDLGYRLTEAGYDVVLDTAVAARHLKRWTVRSAIVTDIRDRGIPWTQLLLRYGGPHDDLNLRTRYRVSVVLVYLALVSIVLGIYDVRFLAGMLPLLIGATILNRRYYRFFYDKRGATFAVRVWLLHLLHHLYNGFSFAAGAVLFLAARYLGVRLPGALAVDAWSTAHSRGTAASAR